MNLRVLIYMNPLVVDKIAKKFLWWKDSGFLYTRQLIIRLPKDWRFTILVPKGFDQNFFDSGHIIDYIEYDYSTSIHQNRYHFNRNILAKAFPYSTDVDVILNMQPEVTANLRVFFMNQRRENPIIINYFHWIDCKESAQFGKELSGFIWRQIEGMVNADTSLFHNPYALSLMAQSRDDNKLNWGEPSCGYFHPQPTIYGGKSIPLPDKKIILFNHRLNNTTGWREVIKACKKLREKRDDFVLWLTDDQNLKENKAFEQYPWIIVQSVPLESYGYLIKNSHFSVCNLKGYGTWNMAVLDSLRNGCFAAVPDSKLFRFMLGISYPMCGSLCWKLNEFLDNTKKENDKLIENAFVDPDPDIVPWIEAQIRGRVGNKDIRKYDDVVKYIISNQPCEKKTFVNELWSFHANSNFQLIRWKLLLEGFKDDIRLPHTIYSKDETLI